MKKIYLLLTSIIFINIIVFSNNANYPVFALDTETSNETTQSEETTVSEDTELYSITFDSAGGSTVNTITQHFSTSISVPENPVREGFTFNGWIPVVPSTMPDYDTVCVAWWTVNQYSIDFNSARGSRVGSITQDYGTSIARPINPVREGYSFNGWIPDVPLFMPAQNIECEAQWKANTYSISYNGNGSTSGTTIVSSHTYGVSQALTANGYTNTGYKFEGWATSPGGEAVYADSQVVLNLTSVNRSTVVLYAIWKFSGYTTDPNALNPLTTLPNTYEFATTNVFNSDLYTYDSSKVTTEKNSPNEPVFIDNYENNNSQKIVIISLIVSSVIAVGAIVTSFIKKKK